MSMGSWPIRLGAMVRLARNCGTVGVSSTGTGDRMRITVAMTSAARKAGSSRPAREMAESRTCGSLVRAQLPRPAQRLPLEQLSDRLLLRQRLDRGGDRLARRHRLEDDL